MLPFLFGAVLVWNHEVNQSPHPHCCGSASLQTTAREAWALRCGQLALGAQRVVVSKVVEGGALLHTTQGPRSAPAGVPVFPTRLPSGCSSSLLLSLALAAASASDI